MASIDTYRLSIRAAIRGYWSGKLTQGEFVAGMQSTISRGLTQAWLAGAKECSTNVNDLTPEEHAKLALFIVEQQGYIGGLANSIARADKQQGGLLQDVIGRADMWANKWTEVQQTAEAMCAGNTKKKFILGNTREHCRSCRGLNGRTYRLSTWLANNAVPPSYRHFQCKGFNCKCKLMDTTDPITKGRFPKGLLV